MQKACQLPPANFINDFKACKPHHLKQILHMIGMLLKNDNHTDKLFPEVKMIDFDTATKDALDKTHPAYIERVWDDGNQAAKSLKHEGCFIDHREMLVHATLEKVICVLKNFGTNPPFQQGEGLGVREKVHSFGTQWIEWRVRHVTDLTYVSQTVFFRPHGLPGFLFWYLLYPFHMLTFRGLIRKIKKQSEAS